MLVEALLIIVNNCHNKFYGTGHSAHNCEYFGRSRLSISMAITYAHRSLIIITIFCQKLFYNTGDSSHDCILQLQASFVLCGHRRLPMCDCNLRW